MTNQNLCKSTNEDPKTEVDLTSKNVPEGRWSTIINWLSRLGENIPNEYER